jgi:hypothetical protein
MRNYGIVAMLVFVVTTSFAQPQEQWFRFFGGEEVETGRMIRPTPDGGFIQLGQTRSFDPTNLDILLVKVDRDGNRQWQRVYPQGDFTGSVRLLDDEGFIIVCYTYDESIVLRLDEYGNVEWEYVFAQDAPSLNDVAITPDGGFLVLGDSPQNSDVFLLRLNSAGEFMWSQYVVRPDNQYVTTIEPGIDGGYVVFGSTETGGPAGYDYFMMFITEGGEEEGFLVHDFGGAQFCREGIRLDDGYMIVGDADPGAGVAIRTNQAGEVLWEQLYTGGIGIYCSTTTPDGGFAFGGLEYVNNQDAWMLKVSDDGTQEWELFYQLNDSQRLYGITADETGAIYGMGQGQAENGDDQDMMLWVVDRSEPDPAPTVTIIPQNPYPIAFPAAGGTLHYGVDIQNDLDYSINVRARRVGHTPTGANVVLPQIYNLTLPANSQQLFDPLQQQIPGGIPSGQYAFIVALFTAGTDSLISQDSVVFTKAE